MLVLVRDDWSTASAVIRTDSCARIGETWMTSFGMEGERTMMDGRCTDSDVDTMVYLPARVICGKGVSCSCLNVSTPRGEVASEVVGISSSMEVRQRPWDEIKYTPIY